MAIDLVSYECAGSIRFGMLRQEVRSLFTGPARSVSSTMYTPVERDQFVVAGTVVEYDTNGRCVFVEVGMEADPRFMGRQLVSVPYRQIAAWFREMDPDIEEDGAGLISRRYGIALYAPSAKKDPDEPVEAAAAFVRGYYDRPAPVVPVPEDRK